ncbi:MAG: HhH-GPD family protein [Actinoallomurus sp.]|jgi:A/G-specific adenine glycosylase|nr:HhH-GPD family protein [Actinoallomurus sp.]
MHERRYAEPVLTWYAENARDLPWRRPDASPWAVLVSELMLQQTPVVRVLPAYEVWLTRWPTPAALAAEPPGEAVRAWGRLGYPRRALNLHASARAIVEGHEGVVPADYDELRALPGVGAYTAAAVASFAYRRRHAVLDTNVRRVLARAVSGVEYPPKSQTTAEVRLAESLLPPDPPMAARWSVAIMELGALVCTARAPRCADCPLSGDCTWRLTGKPPYDGPPRKGQTYAGTDRQCRGRLLAVLRHSSGPVERSALEEVWEDTLQRERALATLIEDGLVDPLPDNRYALPS